MAGNWGDFLDNFIRSCNCNVVKEVAPTGAITYVANDIYILCEINELRIKKIEVGRIKNGFHNNIKGIFTDNNNHNICFIQSSYLDEAEAHSPLEFESDKKEMVTSFLKIPFETGWSEEEFYLLPNRYYKTIVEVKSLNLKWEIILKSFAEQDIPLPFDKLLRWLHLKQSDSALNKNNRRTNLIKVAPIRGLRGSII